jgi:hypothetical protein
MRAMRELDLEKYAQEVNQMQELPGQSVQIPPLAALAIVCHIQMAVRHPEVSGTAFAIIAIDVAKQFQNFFSPDSETFKVLERGWNPETAIIIPSSAEDEPLRK